MASALILTGESEQGTALLARLRDSAEDLSPLLFAHHVQTSGHASIWVEDYEPARRMLDHAIETARSTSALGLLAFPLACRAELDFRTGRWAAAYARGLEAVTIASELGQTSELSFNLVTLARVEAGLGRDRDARIHAGRAVELAEALGVGSILTYAGAVQGFLEIGRGRPNDTIAHLEPIAKLVEHQGLREPATVQWAPDLIESYVLVGREGDALSALNVFQGQGTATGRTWALAAAARCRGMLADDDHFEEVFSEALQWHTRTRTPFERSRTELRFGQRLRRARRPAEAATLLRAALDTFEELGATAWAGQARTEMEAAGGNAPGRRPAPLHQLGPQELQVALLVAEGSTNREVAAALFVSPKTVEFHLGKVYRKLGVRSRTELARLVAQGSREQDL